MGRSVVELAAAAAPDLHVAGGIARVCRSGDQARALGVDRVETTDNAGALLRDADVLVDFSSPDALSELLRTQSGALAGKPLVVGTTGLDASAQRLLDECAQSSAVLVAANFSVGVNLLLGLAETAARALDTVGYDVEIVELHHGRKSDAPSGTALALGEAVARARGQELGEARRDGRSGRTGERPTGEIGFHAVRGGSAVGEHHVLFLGQRDRLELTHAAADRSLFADGALTAARWLLGKPPGRYTMRQVLGV
jgi:4-hydroxy-tetrahydrodipicolinate reductase